MSNPLKYNSISLKLPYDDQKFLEQNTQVYSKGSLDSALGQDPEAVNRALNSVISDASKRINRKVNLGSVNVYVSSK